MSQRYTAGSSDLWIPSANCTASACANKHKYGAANSSTNQHHDGEFSIHYGDGTSVSGPIYSDTGQYQSSHSLMYVH